MAFEYRKDKNIVVIILIDDYSLLTNAQNVKCAYFLFKCRNNVSRRHLEVYNLMFVTTGFRFRVTTSQITSK